MYPKVNQNIVVYIENEDQSFQSLVSDMDEKEIFISLPVDGISLRNLPVHTKINVFYLTDENQFKFQSEIIEKKIDRIPLYRIVKPQIKDIIKIQRRDNFRVKSNLLLKLNGLELTTINISAGGMLFSCREELKLQVGEIISGSLFVPYIENKEVDPIIFQGQIKRITLIENLGIQYAAVEFIKLKDRDQMNIMQYCFNRQKQNRIKNTR